MRAWAWAWGSDGLGLEPGFGLGLGLGLGQACLLSRAAQGCARRGVERDRAREAGRWDGVACQHRIGHRSGANPHPITTNTHHHAIATRSLPDHHPITTGSPALRPRSTPRRRLKLTLDPRSLGLRAPPPMACPMAPPCCCARAWMEASVSAGWGLATACRG